VRPIQRFVRPVTLLENFDIVMNCEVIEHLQEPEKMLREIKRILKMGGKLVLTTPYRLTETPTDVNHVREYFPDELKTLLDRHFASVNIKLTHHIFWYGLYNYYPFRRLFNRQFGRWLVNAMTLWFRCNPFMIDYKNPAKRDLCTQILAWGIRSS